MTIIYEVNIEVDESMAEDFKGWINQHINEMLAVDGFESATLLKELNVSYRRWCVHYKVTSMKLLEQYFDNHAPKMRQYALDKFGDSIQLNRRILGEIDE